MMQTLWLSLLIAFACPCSGQTPKALAPITKNERAEIEVIIKRETTEKILSIERESPDTVKVSTGIITPGKLEGKGQSFKLKRTKKGWEIKQRGLWVS